MTIVTYTTPNSSNVPVTISWYLGNIIDGKGCTKNR